MKKIVLLLPGLLLFYNISKESPIIIPPPPPQSYFEAAYSNIRKWEGWYVNNPYDKGKVTYAGITKLYNKNWYGWRYIKSDSFYTNQKFINAEMWVKDYYLDLWIREGFDQIKDKALAVYVFDLRVHSSRKTVIRLINNVLKELKYDNYQVVNKENWIPILFNYTHSGIFIKYLKKRRIKFYENIVKRDSTQRIFLKGWVRRATQVG